MSQFLWNRGWQGRKPQGDSHQPARNVITPSGGIFRGKFPSNKNGRMVRHEGLLEGDAISLFEMSPTIARYREQPVTLQYPGGDRLRRYTPDFEIVLHTGELIYIEVKPEKNLNKEEVKHKLSCVGAYMQRSGFLFVVLTEQVLSQQPRLTNLQRLYRQSPRKPPSIEAMKMAMWRHSGRLPMTFGDAQTLFLDSGIHVISLMIGGFVRCPLDLPINSTTLLTDTRGDNNDWFFIAQEHGF